MRAPQFTTDGTLASNGDLELTLQGNQVNTGNYSANGSLTVNTTGSITNQGHISAQRNLSLVATGIDNQAGAVIDSQVTTLNVGGGTINNAGLINSTAGQTSVTAGTVNNTGRIYGDSIAISGTTNNSIGAGGAAVIASRGGDVTLNGQLNNTDGAQVFSLGSIQINGSANNAGSTINAARNVTITGALQNTNAGFSTGSQTRSESAGGFYITPSGSTTRYDANTLGWSGYTGGHYVLPSATYPFATFGADPRAAAVQCGLAGGGAEGGDWTCNYTYGTADPIWAAMRVAPPSTAGLVDPGAPPGAQGCMFYGETGDSRDMGGDCGVYWTQRDAYDSAWTQRQTAAYANLDSAISAFNADLNSRTLIDWYETTITGKTITETSVTSSRPGYVLAGGNISLGGGTNSDSVIVAGGSINAAGGNNYASPGTRVTTTNGTMVFSHRVYHGGFSDSYSRDVSAPQPIADGSVTESFNLPILQFQSSGSPSAPTSGGNSTPVGGATAVVPGVGAGVGSARNANTAGTATGTTQSGTPAAGGGGAVQVGTTTTGQPQGAPGVTSAQIASATTVATTSGNTPSGGNTTVTAGTGNSPSGGNTTIAAGTGNTPTGAAAVTTGAGTGATGGSTVTTGTGNTPTTGGSAVTAGTGANPSGGSTTAITASLNAAPQAALPGSVIAGGVRAGQLAAITTSLTNFADAARAQPIQAAAVDTTARRTTPVAVKAAGYTTVRASGAVRAPSSQLFTLNRSPRGPLIETDPAFTGYRTWISSAYMLTQLAIDPERNLKLYGDGFAEQRLIDDQILALTGRRFLSNYQSTEDEYQDLLDSGVMFARQYQLTPGVALSAEQMALLTTDIVWLEAKAVTLPDGSTVQALVPTVYLRRPVNGDLTPTGALIAGSNVTLRSQGDLTNTGTIVANGDKAAGDGKLTITGNNVANTGTLGGNAISVTAQQTLDNTGGVIQGLGNASTIALNARDITLRTTTQTNVREIEGPNGTSTGTRTNVDRIATVSADSVTLAALNNVSLQGATVRAAGDLSVTAGGSITTDAVATGYTLNVPLGGGGAQGRTSNYSVVATTQQLTTFDAGRNVTLAAVGDATFKGTNAIAGNDLSVKAQNISIEAAKDSLAIDQQGVNKKGFERVAKADETLAGGAFAAGNNVSLIADGARAQGQGNITATGATIAAASGQASLIANNNVTIQNATTEHSQATESYDSKKGFLSKGSTERAQNSQTTQVEGSNVSGSTVLVQAGTDATVQASQLNARNDLQINAGRDVNVTSAQEVSSASSFFEQKKSGLDISLGQISIGKAAQDQTQALQSTNQVGSQVAGANVRMAAGRDATVTASAVLADQNIDVNAGRNININSATNTEATQAQAHSSATTIGLAPTGLSGRFTLFGEILFSMPIIAL